MEAIEEGKDLSLQGQICQIKFLTSFVCKQHTNLKTNLFLLVLQSVQNVGTSYPSLITFIFRIYIQGQIFKMTLFFAGALNIITQVSVPFYNRAADFRWLKEKMGPSTLLVSVCCCFLKTSKLHLKSFLRQVFTSTQAKSALLGKCDLLLQIPWEELAVKGEKFIFRLATF